MSRLLNAAGGLVDRIKINAVSREWRGGRGVWIKRRRWTAGVIIAGANQFFGLAGNPIRAIPECAAWQRWEVDCFLRLHGEKYRASAAGERAVEADELPGQSLSDHLNAGTLTAEMVAAAATEMRRAHAMECAAYDGAWSHGDPHSGNFLFDPLEGRARLIDFEVMHHRGLTAEDRHLDDLLIFLQDLAGRISGERWLPCAQAFLAAYGRSELTARLRPKLDMPRGVARVWWAVRTTYLAPAELMWRLTTLRESL